MCPMMTQPGPLSDDDQADHDLRTCFYQSCIFLWGWTHQVLALHLAPLLPRLSGHQWLEQRLGVVSTIRSVHLKYYRNTLFWSFHSGDKYLGWHCDMTLGHCSEVCVMRHCEVNTVSTVTCLTSLSQHQHHCLEAMRLFSWHKVLIYPN